MAGKDIGLLACLAEVRGDWAMFKDTLNLPGWQGKGPICHKCNCTLAELHQVSMDAPWRLVTGGHSCLGVPSCLQTNRAWCFLEHNGVNGLGGL